MVENFDSGVPFDQDDADDDFQLSGGIVDGKSTKKLIEENTFPPVPRGRNDYYVKKVEVLTKTTEGYDPKQFPCFTEDSDGDYTVADSYSSHEIEVTFALVEKPAVTIRDKFRMVPLDENERELYLHAASEEGGKAGSGFWWSKLKIFYGSIGFDADDEGNIPVEAETLGNWRRWPDGSFKVVSIDIGDQIDKNKEKRLDNDGKPWPNIKLFSHRKSTDTQERLGILPPSNDDGEPPKPSRKPAPTKPTPPAKPATASKPTTAPAGSTKPFAKPAPASTGPARPAQVAAAPPAAAKSLKKFF